MGKLNDNFNWNKEYRLKRLSFILAYDWNQTSVIELLFNYRRKALSKEVDKENIECEKSIDEKLVTFFFLFFLLLFTLKWGTVIIIILIC